MVMAVVMIMTVSQGVRVSYTDYCLSQRTLYFANLVPYTNSAVVQSVYGGND